MSVLEYEREFKITAKEFMDRFIKLNPKTNVTTIIGTMGSGKSTLALFLSYYLFLYYTSKDYNVYIREIDVFREYYSGKINAESLFMSSSDVNIFILEDTSFLLNTRNKRTLELLNTITRIRHITNTDYNYIIVIAHYTRSIAPFLRASNTVFLTSITPAEIPSLKELFHVSTLYDYLEDYMLNPYRYIYLVRLRCYEEKIDFTLNEDTLDTLRAFRNLFVRH